MLQDAKDIGVMFGVNVVGVIVTLSDMEQWIRLLTGLAVLIFSAVKAYKAVKSLRQ